MRVLAPEHSFYIGISVLSQGRSLKGGRLVIVAGISYLSSGASRSPNKEGFLKAKEAPNQPKKQQKFGSSRFACPRARISRHSIFISVLPRFACPCARISRHSISTSALPRFACPRAPKQRISNFAERGTLSKKNYQTEANWGIPVDFRARQPGHASSIRSKAVPGLHASFTVATLYLAKQSMFGTSFKNLFSQNDLPDLDSLVQT
ncbi:hypothetical protein HYC85_029332 [Camellia sinensis]|uniref:Uncharacterized protein n=1 Tax=Camellia sinensis TaxID=4442 RepID=A0A7J7FYY4_CAMSI|nr:hypothetical protein HYC85_029332 [Camellia sinensis]